MSYIILDNYRNMVILYNGSGSSANIIYCIVWGEGGSMCRFSVI